MRWPFHFGKAARPEHDAAREPAAPPRRLDWASLAPIQRTIGDPPLTAASVEFSQSLAGSEEPALSLEPLGHHRSPEGPQGIVTGIASPVESYSHSTELVVRPRHHVDAAVSVQAEAEGPAENDAGTVAAEEDAAPGRLKRVLPAVSDQAARTPAVAMRLTDAGKVEVGPLRPVQRAPESPDSADPAAAPVVEQPPVAPPPGTRLSLGLSRRHGLGAPIRGADSASLQRSMQPAARADAPAPGTSQLPASPPAVEPRASVIVPVSQTSAPKLDDVRARSGESEAILPPLPPARRQTSSGHSEDSGDGTTPGAAEAETDTAPMVREAPDAEAPPARIAAPAAGEVVPLQRLAGPVPVRPAVPDPVRMPALHRAASTEPLISARPSLSTIRPASESQQVSPPTRQSPPRFGAALAPMPLPAVPPSPPLSWSPAVQPASRPATARGPLIWNLQRMVAGETPGGGPESPDLAPRAADAGPASEAPTMAASPPPVPTAGSAPAGGIAAEAGPRPGESVTAGAGTPGPGSAPAAHGEKELDELAHVLFPKLMSLVRFDLLIERERAGLVTDLR